MRGSLGLLPALFFICAVHATKIPSIACPPPKRYAPSPPTKCELPNDPQNRSASRLEEWFTQAMFEDLFPKANLGWAPNDCRPYNYKAFIIAARYFPSFGTTFTATDPTGAPLPTHYTPRETYGRDVAAFFAHAIQETGENDRHLYDVIQNKTLAGDCFYRGGLYNWFEGGPESSLVEDGGVEPNLGENCTFNGQYCDPECDNKWFYPCHERKVGPWYKDCFFGRGAIQISYNFNYGQFGRWLRHQGVKHQGAPIDILKHPNLVVTKKDPPLAFMASLWFYMTPQSPKPAMHDIITGQWVSPDPDYAGSVFGPTSLVINDECNGEDPTDPGGPGESRRIKAFRWFTGYFCVPFNRDSPAKTTSCRDFNNGSRDFKFSDGRLVMNSWDVDWRTSSETTQPCQCHMYKYQGDVSAYDPQIMPQYWRENEENKAWCESIYRGGYKNLPCSHYVPDVLVV